MKEIKDSYSIILERIYVFYSLIRLLFSFALLNLVSAQESTKIPMTRNPNFKNILWVLFLLSNITFSQTNKPNIKFYTLEDGLSQATINDLLKDSSGFIWIATEDGLNRFDGKEFKHFKYIESDSTSISGNVLNKLCEDEKGNIWVGTIGNGLNYYDKNLDAFKKIKLEYASNTETISDILVGDNGIVWVTTRTSGLHRLQPKEDGSYIQKNFLSNKRLGAISIDKDESYG